MLTTEMRRAERFGVVNLFEAIEIVAGAEMVVGVEVVQTKQYLVLDLPSH